MKYTEEQLKKYGIRSVSAISEASFKPRIIVRNLDSTEYFYDIDELTESAIDDILDKHIKEYYICEIRKEKLEKLNEI
jgi:hypothetical protein